MTILNAWLKQFHQLIEGDARFFNLNNKEISDLLGISERQFFRRIKKITNLPPQKYLRTYRLQLAKKYMESGTYCTVNETAFAIGYVNVSYFITQFEEEYGKKPLQVLQEAGWR